MHARSGQLQGIFGFLKPLIHVWILVWSWSVDKNDGVLKDPNVCHLIHEIKLLKKNLINSQTLLYLCSMKSASAKWFTARPIRTIRAAVVAIAAAFAILPRREQLRYWNGSAAVSAGFIQPMEGVFGIWRPTIHTNAKRVLLLMATRHVNWYPNFGQ